MDNNLANKYFKEIKLKPFIIGAIISLIVTLIGINVTPLLIVGIIGLVIFIGIPVYLNVTRPTDEQYDAYVKGSIPDLLPLALEESGHDESEVKEIDPIILGDYDLVSANNARPGKDGKWRTDNYINTVVLFTADTCVTYIRKFTTNNPGSPLVEAETYFYNDIVSFATKTNTANVNGNQISFSEFVMTTSAGTTVSCVIDSSDQEVKRSINGAKQLLLEKKKA